MRLNDLQPAADSRKKPKRVGRGLGSGAGKTAGRGHKGQNSRAGGSQPTGFEGGQMPLQRRLPKVGFRSRRARLGAEVRLHEIDSIGGEVDLAALKKANVIARHILYAKVIKSGTLTKAVTVKGLRVTQGARASIEALGGKVED